MLTLFTCVMPFQGKAAVIQRNAIKSWTLLRPQCEILLFGDGPGIEEAASELGARRVKGVACNEYGTPLVNDIFNRAESLALNTHLCYINSHVILMGDFMKALRKVLEWRSGLITPPRGPRLKARDTGGGISLERKETPGFSPKGFIMISRRWDADIDRPLEFVSGWEGDLLRRRRRHDRYAIEYLVFPKGIWPEIPPFAVGRPWYDWWFLRKARDVRVPVVDASRVVAIVHQRHDYSHVRGSRDPAYGFKYAMSETPEAKENLRLSGFTECTRVTLNDADHELDRSGVRLKFRERIKRACRRLLYP